MDLDTPRSESDRYLAYAEPGASYLYGFTPYMSSHSLASMSCYGHLQYYQHNPYVTMQCHALQHPHDLDYLYAYEAGYMTHHTHSGAALAAYSASLDFVNTTPSFGTYDAPSSACLYHHAFCACAYTVAESAQGMQHAGAFYPSIGTLPSAYQYQSSSATYPAPVRAPLAPLAESAPSAPLTASDTVCVFHTITNAITDTVSTTVPNTASNTISSTAIASQNLVFVEEDEEPPFDREAYLYRLRDYHPPSQALLYAQYLKIKAQQEADAKKEQQDADEKKAQEEADEKTAQEEAEAQRAAAAASTIAQAQATSDTAQVHALERKALRAELSMQVQKLYDLEAEVLEQLLQLEVAEAELAGTCAELTGSRL
ncbi:hypothetical protein BD626DRAFT_39282 [Schizophyllum amplum]|uniref:Uncharacterized protein n=1 Tax=Schizophyllum amplum TaxID=97359 RepID=A0A550BSY1_9AGAR|nr:hypothetical protein BD626DRAFT_39282 [Auriculariopsis ampla]